VAAYLDASDYVQTQLAVYDAIANWTPGIHGQPRYFRYKGTAPNRLTSRLNAFGSRQAVEVFQRAETLNENVPKQFHALVNKSGEPVSAPDFLFPSDYWIRDAGGGLELSQSFLNRYNGFARQVYRFEQVVRSDLQ
jgi:hypothetical protein